MRVSEDLPPFVHRKIAKGKTYYYFAVQGVERNARARLVRLPDITHPNFRRRVDELYQHRPVGEARRVLMTKEPKVYFIGSDDGPVKIGMSREPEARCREMNVGAPTDYRVLATTPGSVELERAYHERFGFAHLRGEWFERRPEIQAEIDRLNKTGK